MSKTYLIGIDIGTQGTKTAIYDGDGSLLASASEASNLISPNPGVVEQDPEEIFMSVIRTIKESLAQSKVLPQDIAGISIDAQMAGIMGIDQQWQAVTCYDSWLDTRCEPYIELMKREAEEEIIGKTGGQVTYVHGPKVLWWKHEHPEIYKKIAKFIMPSTYVSGRLCGLRGEQAYIDKTHIHFSSFGDSKRMIWDKELLRQFKVEEEKMPQMIKPHEVIGKVTKEWADATGLLEGTPVVAGCGDSAASSLGAGIVEKGLVYDVAGTASIFSCSTDIFQADVKNKTLLYAASVVDGLYIPLAYIGGGGMCISWFSKLHGINLEELGTLAKEIPPGSEGLLFSPHFAGSVCPNRQSLPGAFVGLKWNHQIGHMYRSILESIAYEYYNYFSIIRELAPQEYTRIYGTGGGAKSPIFNQIKADVLGLPYHQLKTKETATFGSALLAGLGVGLYDDLSKTHFFDDCLGEQTQPNEELSELYETKAKQYHSLLERLDGALL